MLSQMLSRIETNALLSGQPPQVDFVAMAATQSTDPAICSLQSSQTSTWKLSHLLTLLTISTVTLLLALKDPLYHNLGVALYSTLYTDSLILVFVPPKN